MKRPNKIRSRIFLAVAAATLIGGLAWLWGSVDDAPPAPEDPVVRSAKIEAATTAAERQAIASAAREARGAMRAKQPAAEPVLPKNMPPLGLPSTATHLATQRPPDQPMPTPRGSR